MSLSELQQYDAIGLAGLIASGAISQTEAVSQAISAIESLSCDNALGGRLFSGEF